MADATMTDTIRRVAHEQVDAALDPPLAEGARLDGENASKRAVGVDLDARNAEATARLASKEADILAGESRLKAIQSQADLLVAKIDLVYAAKAKGDAALAALPR